MLNPWCWEQDRCSNMNSTGKMQNIIRKITLQINTINLHYSSEKYKCSIWSKYGRIFSCIVIHAFALIQPINIFTIPSLFISKLFKHKNVQDYIRNLFFTPVVHLPTASRRSCRCFWFRVPSLSLHQNFLTCAAPLTPGQKTRLISVSQYIDQIYQWPPKRNYMHLVLTHRQNGAKRPVFNFFRIFHLFTLCHAYRHL